MPPQADQSLQDIVKQFLDGHKIVEAIQDNARVVVLNHELTLDQVIEAMIVEQSSIFALIWNSELKEFTGIVTLRNILDLITSLCESFDQWLREQTRKPMRISAIGSV